MTAGELRRAIEGPAERAGLEVEPALVDALVDDVAGEAGGLPLLSTALSTSGASATGRSADARELRAHRRRHRRRRAPRRGGLPVARRRETSRSRRRSCSASSPAGRRGSSTRRRAYARAELDAERRRATSRASSRRSSSGGCSSPTTGRSSSSHEALLEQWPRLVGWLEEDVRGPPPAPTPDAGGLGVGGFGAGSERALPRRAARGGARVARAHGRPLGAQPARRRVPRGKPCRRDGRG